MTDEKAPKKIVSIEITSDLACFWCFAGKRRLEKAISLLDSTKVEVKVSWLPYSVCCHPPATAGTKREICTLKFGTCFPTIEARAAALKDTDGIAIDWDGPYAPTFDAHRLTLWARDSGKQNQLVEQLFHEYLELRADISDVAVLSRIARDVGLDGEAALRMLQSGELVEEVKEVIQKGRAKGITGVPHFVVDKTFQFSGAQPVDFYQCVFSKLGVFQLPPGLVLRCLAKEADSGCPAQAQKANGAGAAQAGAQPGTTQEAVGGCQPASAPA